MRRRGVGSLGGALMSRRLAEWLGIGKAMILTATISLSSLLLIPMAHANATGFVLLGAHQLIGDCFAVAFVIQAVSLRQIVLPVDVLGRANAAIVACTTAVLTATALLAGWLGEAIGIRDAVWVGVLSGLVGPLFLLSMWRLREAPPGVSAAAAV